MIVIKTPRWRWLLLVLGASGFVAVGAWLMTRPESLPVGLGSVLFFGLCGGVGLHKLLRDRFALVIDRDGIIDNASGVSAGRVLWEEITAVRIEGTFLGIDVRDREALYARRPAGLLQRANAGLGFCPITIPAMAMDRSLEEVARLVTRYLEFPESRKELVRFES